MTSTQTALLESNVESISNPQSHLLDASLDDSYQKLSASSKSKIIYHGVRSPPPPGRGPSTACPMTRPPRPIPPTDHLAYISWRGTPRLTSSPYSSQWPYRRPEQGAPAPAHLPSRLPRPHARLENRESTDIPGSSHGDKTKEERAAPADKDGPDVFCESYHTRGEPDAEQLYHRRALALPPCTCHSCGSCGELLLVSVFHPSFAPQV